MPNSCNLVTTCHAHAVLHRLHEIATSLVEDYEAVDLPYHQASTEHGDLYLTRILPNNGRIHGKLSQTEERLIEATITSPADDNAENIRELVGPLVMRYLSNFPDASDHIAQQFHGE